MPSTIICPSPFRERILAYGTGGTGKSTIPWQIMRRATTARGYMLDIDYSPSAGVIGSFEYPELYASGRMEIAPVMPEEFAKQLVQIEDWDKEATEDDWLFVDSATHGWTAVQGEYAEEAFGHSRAQHHLDARRKQLRTNAKTMNPFEGDTDWNVIKPMYFQFYAALARWPGHVYITAEQKPLGDRDKGDDKQVFGAFCFRPDGESKLRHITRTVVWMKKTRGGEFEYTVVKDRGRESKGVVEDRPWGMERSEDFVKRYLVEVAGWKTGKIESPE